MEMDFEFICSTICLDGAPPRRPYTQIRCILAKAYELANLPLFGKEDNRIFDVVSRPHLAIDRTTVERLLLELDALPQLTDVPIISSHNTEETIDMLSTLAIVLPQLSGHEYEMHGQLLFGGWLQAMLRYLVDITRTGVIMTNQIEIQHQLSEMASTTQKVAHLKYLMLSYQQRKEFYDPAQYQAMYDFLKLEKKKWKLHMDVSLVHFTTTAELVEYVSHLISTELEHSIRQRGGYKNFWRDEQCTQDKKETEVQQYIRSILEPACRQKGIRIYREVAAADGSIDMLFTYAELSVCLEIKKAQHPDVRKATHKQLLAYM